MRAAAGVVVTLVAVAAVAGLERYREQLILRAPLLPVAFDHHDHARVHCFECHHNFSDDTGRGLCYDCHKRDPEVALDIQAMFHDLCRDCHVAERRAGKVAGPTRICGECHFDPTTRRDSAQADIASRAASSAMAAAR